MGKLKDQLAGIAALIAAIVAIGGGFIKYGEITTKLDSLANQTPEQAQEVADNAGNMIDNKQAITVLETEMELLKFRLQDLRRINKSSL